MLKSLSGLVVIDCGWSELAGQFYHRTNQVRPYMESRSEYYEVPDASYYPCFNM